MSGMAGRRRAKISGTGMCVPDRIVTNEDLATRMDTSDEWIQKRTGIRERRYIEPGTEPSDLALTASENALEAAGLEPAFWKGVIEALKH